MQPETLDLLIVGGGPAGIAAALRARELSMSTTILEMDDVMRRIRDYSKDKLILPSFGGGDRMPFPVGGEWIARLAFEPIDKDQMHRDWKALCGNCQVPVLLGHELLRLDGGDGDAPMVAVAYDHTKRREVPLHARHVALALGRGVPRRFDIPGDTGDIAVRLTDAQNFVGAPACVVGGGTSAAEAVIAISHAKATAGDTTPTHWSYRGDKLPRVSKALAEVFFEAYLGNGNIRYHPHSEPLMITTGDDREEYLAIRVDRRAMAHRATEASLLEFPKAACLACIGEDVPERQLGELGIRMARGGAKQRKRMLVNRFLETERPRVYLIGDILSQAYFRTDEFPTDAGFSAEPSTFEEVRHRGNIKSALHDGVLVAQVVRQRLDGVEDRQIDTAVEVGDAPIAQQTTDSGSVEGTTMVVPLIEIAKSTPREAAAWLIRILPGGAETEDHPLYLGTQLAIGRQDCDLTFDDDLLSPRHASITLTTEGGVLRDEGSDNGVFVRVPSRRKLDLRVGDLLRAGRQFLLVQPPAEGDADGGPIIAHYDAAGRAVARHQIPTGALVLGRDTLDPDDGTLSRRHVAFAFADSRLQVKDLLSSNGSYVRVQGAYQLELGDEILCGHQRFVFTRQPDDVLDAGLEAPRPSKPTTAAAQAPDQPAASAPIQGPIDGPSVTFRPSGQVVAASPGQTILDVAEANGIRIKAECHAGICGSDPIRILAGLEHLVGEPDDGETETLEDLCGLEAGPCRLACMARINGPVEVEILDS